MIEGIKTYGSDELTKKLQECDDPVFLITIGTTETSLIDGISGAGPSADLTEYTPASDVEFMVLGEVRCCEAPAETVVGDAAAPTPARLTKASLQLSNIPFVVVDAGSKIKPDIEYVSFGKEYGRDIRTGKGVLNPLEIFENAKDLGSELSRRHEMLIIGESIAAGTTTALGVLRALGYDANEKVSGSMPYNPHDMKTKVVDEGLKNAGLDPEKDEIDAIQAIAAVGDPTLPAISGLVLGSDIPIILAGGTQMAAVCAIIKSIKPNFDFSRINLATTVYVAGDETADLFGILKQIDESITVNVVDPEFEKSTHEGLKNYLKGFVKEGAGAGGAMYTALVLGNSREKLRKRIEKICK
ncbi:nicotinate mononucleotide-dependent phosphoribosyltransferase CobT [Methanobrevibacter sp.]|uniref:nicotinate mononucleotide-dependent phosphoribosyltransferase CobT n=1 Tax=Methanobrevibacter sp. TaxID=66852 RepID=UPI0025CE4795|nr:TIGR00303 family protein [Methanobrevibacter sp.]MBQ2831260.1 TIGR00303 family protein [Methanobrevibacter sp.]